jgi:hypothetical protein
MGRQKTKIPEELFTVTAFVRLTPAMAAQAREAAKVQGLGLGTMLRSLLVNHLRSLQDQR